MYITAALILAAKKACTLLKHHLNKLRYIHASEYYAAECGSSASAMLKDVTNTLWSREQFLSGVNHCLHVMSRISRDRGEEDGDRHGVEKTMQFSPSMLLYFWILFARNIYVIINFKKQGLGRQVFTVKLQPWTSGKNLSHGPNLLL